ncbi:MAG: YqcC family protein [Candidatus Pelagadaptatus aseana]
MALAKLEQELRQLQLWQQQRPSDTALASTQPFCVDTLTLPQWLQFIFLERMQMLVKNQQPLPNQCGIAPIAEEYLKGAGINGAALIKTLEDIDQILSRQSH